MGTFTVQLTVTGQSAGQPISFSNTYTLSSIEDLVKDGGEAYAGETITTVNGSNVSAKRGAHAYVGARFVIAMNETRGAEAFITLNGNGDSLSLNMPTSVPIMVHHSDDYDSAFMYDGTTAGAPDQDVENVEINAYTSMRYRVFALSNPMS